jgi:hypothetical protein
MAWIRILLLMYLSYRYLSCKCFVKHANSSLQILISILIWYDRFMNCWYEI